MRRVSARKTLFALALFAPAAALILGGAWVLHRFNDRLAVARVETNQKLATGLGSRNLSLSFSTIIREVRYFSDQQSLRSLLTEDTSANLKAVIRDFQAFSDYAGIIDQMRWIDESGWERLNVSGRPGQPLAVKKGILRKETGINTDGNSTPTKPDNVYISSIEFIKKAGQTGDLSSPTVHLSTAVEDDNGKHRGLLILHYDARPLLNSLNFVPATLADGVILLDENGQWLNSKDPREESEIARKQRINFAQRHPDLWKRMQLKADGQVHTQSGLWTWQSVYPLEVIGVPQSMRLGTYEGKDGPTQPRPFIWKVVSRVSPSQLATIHSSFGGHTLSIAGGLLLLMAVVSWLLASAMDLKVEADAMLRAMARVDGLTKVLNHITFMEELANSFSIYRRSPQFGVWVVMLDLDRFKLVNDTYGHAGGDRVLTHFSQLLRQNLRDSDTAGRIGGEEFSVMLRGTDQAGALEFCRRLQEALASHPVRFGEKELAITFSGGCSCFQPQDRSGADALQRADTALYEAKWKGRDQIQVAMTTPP